MSEKSNLWNGSCADENFKKKMKSEHENTAI